MDVRERYLRRYALDRLLVPELAESLVLRARRAGELIVRAGEDVRELLFLVEGRAKAYSFLENGQSVLASFFAPLDVLGEVELFSAERYTLSVEALTPTICLALPVPTIKQAGDRSARLFMYLCGRLGEKLADRAMADSINLRYPVENRLASYLLVSIDAEGGIIGTDDLSELADFIGASYRQLARVVRRFRDLGILERARGRIRVLDASRLGAFARDLYRKPGTRVSPRDFLPSEPGPT